MRPWYLESVATDGSHVTHVIRALPFRIGRDPLNDLSVEARGLSRLHAEFREDDGTGLLLVDLGSTNGTWVNRQRITEPRRVRKDDIVHFGNAEFRLGLETQTQLSSRALGGDDGERTMLVPTGAARLSQHFVEHEKEFRELLGGQGLSAAVQPIVRATDGEVFAYELLGRCEHPTLREPPGRLFDIAHKLDLKAALSAAFRDHGVPLAAPHLAGRRLFVNTDPGETFTEAFFESLRALRALPAPPRLVVEVHETAVMEIERMRELAARLTGLGVEFAYDDFGAGASRLNELGEVPPHYVKFDMSLIRGLHEAPASKQKTVADLVRLVRGIDSVPLAEGVETEAEAAVCRAMGFELIQGYLTGRPMPVAALVGG